MLEYFGKTVCEGIVFGKIAVVKKKDSAVTKHKVKDAMIEVERFREAKKKAVHGLGELYLKAEKEVGSKDAAVFLAHQQLLLDAEYSAAVENIITVQKVNAEYAVKKAADSLFELFSTMDDAYMQERGIDIEDISERMLSILLGSHMEFKFDEPVIVLADDLTPSETMQMDKEKVLAFVTVRGSLSSHTAILARMMNIPALVGTEIPLDEDFEGAKAIVDGKGGRIIIEPGEEEISWAKNEIVDERKQRELLEQVRGRETVTKDGRKIHLYANVKDLDDISRVIACDGEGIGLFRTEFLYLGRKSYPTEEEQFEIYKQAALMMKGKKVVIRTLDIGADKRADYFGLEKEDNPAMGFRGIRISLFRKKLFKIQLRGILRAGVFGEIAALYPMIISLEEIEQIKQIVLEVKQELKEAGIAYKDVEEGVMIETPAAAVISDMLAKEVDFFSIGTNDLTQYTLAIDRQNTKLSQMYNPRHPAVMRMIRLVIENAHRNGIKVGICGEAASDLILAKEFVKMGIDELSVAPPFVLPVRKVIREMELE